MDSDAVAKVGRQVVRNFPEMAGIRPTVKVQSAPSAGSDQFVLTYKGKVSLPGGKQLSRIVRVVADERGGIIRISTSR
jgi:hypothetical protein